MPKTVIDIETTNFNDNPSPFMHENYLVSVGFKEEKNKVWGKTKYLCFNHNKGDRTLNAEETLQKVLYRTELLIGHNIKFDLSWLLECGFMYYGSVYDTMIFEYLKAASRPNVKLDLSSCCYRRRLPVKYNSTEEYQKEKIGFERMPWDIVKEYGINDVNITHALYESQRKELDE
jgi:DNA polymerase I-like protein with 3'-5' exonuclease and polymerase domains